MQKLDLPIFLDLKLHDIPNTVAGAVRSVSRLGIEYLTVHGAGGPAMLAAAQAAAAGRVKLLGITVLTSLDEADLTAVGQQTPMSAQVERLALLVQAGGLPGLVCSPLEIAPLRARLGRDFTLMVPGVRPAGAASGDQKRTLTPAESRSRRGNLDGHRPAHYQRERSSGGGAGDCGISPGCPRWLT